MAVRSTTKVSEATPATMRRRSQKRIAWGAARALLAILLTAWGAARATAQVFMSEAEALKILQPQAAWAEEVKTLDERARAELQQSTRLRFAETSYHFQVARQGGQVAGYALTLEEIGKSEPITFIVGLDPAGKVADVLLLVFRESRGAEVRDQRFLRQFRGKSARDPLQVGRDILNYPGATLSSKALARGVRKAISLFQHFYGSTKPEGGSRAFIPPAPASERALPPASRQELPGLSLGPVHYVQARYLMGTVCAVEVYARDRGSAERAAGAAFEALKDVDRRMSNYRPESELSQVNREAGARPVRVSEELYTVLDFAERVSRASDGAFDITVAPLLRAWGFLPERVGMDGPPRRDAGASSSPLAGRPFGLVVGYQKVRLDPVARTVWFTAPGVELDLGGIAKGYAVDQAVRALRREGIPAARVSTGGSTVYALGAPPEHPEGWQLTLPVGEPLTLRDAAVSTSGRDGHFVEIAGRRYSHIFDPRRGEPISTDISTVSVRAPSAMESDALTKPFFILSEREQEGLVRSFSNIRVWVDRPHALRARGVTGGTSRRVTGSGMRPRGGEL